MLFVFTRICALVAKLQVVCLLLNWMTKEAFYLFEGDAQGFDIFRGEL